MALSRTPSWGPKITTKDYILEMEAETYFAPFYKLPGHSLGTPEPETQDAIMIRNFEWEEGRVVETEFYHRKGYNRSFAFPLALAPGEVLWSALQDVANSRATCRRDFLATYLCAEDSRYSHFLYMPQSILDELLPSTAMISTTDDEEPATHETTLRTSFRRTYYALKTQEQGVHGSGNPLYAVGWKNANCASCQSSVFQNGIIGGGAGGTVGPQLRTSTDRFVNSSAISNSLANGSIITDLYQEGDLILATWADAVDTSAGSATTGGVLVSFDGGTNTSSTTLVPLYGLVRTEDYYIAVGKAGAIYRSQDGSNWTQLTNSLAAAGIHYTDIAYDKETGHCYIAGYNGSNSVAHKLTDTTVADITSQVAAGANLLFCVAVFSKDNVAFGGASGVLRWNSNVSDGTTFRLVSAGGTTSAIRGLGGNRIRQFVAAGTNVYERSPLTENMFKRLIPESGTTISGNINALVTGENFIGLNYALAVTSQGEVIAITPHYPRA